MPSCLVWKKIEWWGYKHSLVRRRLCDLHCMVVGKCFLSLRSSHVQQSIDSQPVVRGRLCHILSFVVGKCFWHFARSAIFHSQLLDQNRHFCLYPTCIRRPRYGGSRRNSATPFGIEKLEWCGYPTLKKFRRYVYSF